MEVKKRLMGTILVNGRFGYTYNERIIHVIKPLIRLLKDDRHS